MRVLVLGAGVIGTATAWHATLDGHEVAVVDRREGAGLGDLLRQRRCLDTGHGTLGWTQACGSGRALADILSGRKPDVDFAFTA